MPISNTDVTEALHYEKEVQAKCFFFSWCKTQPLGGGDFSITVI
jgi:hypothetical protein